MVDVPIERCVTGIKGFDALCNGGFVRNSDNVVIGGPGTGKTTFLLQFLYNGATMFNENGLYCSFEPDVIEILKDGMAHGWDFAKLNEENRIKFLKFSPHTAIDELKSEMLRLVSRYQIKRVCFDPISVLALHLGDVGKVRETVFELSSLMKRLKVTSLMSDETFEEQDLLGKGPGNNYAKTDIIRFLSDSVVMFFDSKMVEKGERSLKIVKMRRTNHFRKFVGMDISNSGVNINVEGLNLHINEALYSGAFSSSPKTSEKNHRNAILPQIPDSQNSLEQQTPVLTPSLPQESQGVSEAPLVPNQQPQFTGQQSPLPASQPVQGINPIDSNANSQIAGMSAPKLPDLPQGSQGQQPSLEQTKQPQAPQQQVQPLPQTTMDPKALTDPYALSAEEQQFLQNGSQQQPQQGHMITSDDGTVVKRPQVV